MKTDGEGGGAARRLLFGFQLDALTMDEVTERCLRAVAEDQPVEIGVVNAAKIVRSRRDSRLRDAVTGCDLVLADGQAVVWASRLLRRPLPERVAGIDLFMRLLGEAERHRLRVYFLGAKQETLDLMLREVAALYPALAVAGARNGYFDAGEAPAVAADIAESRADLLFLGMTSPKKEIFVAEYGAKAGARVIHGVGGSFDILAGEIRRAPIGWQRLGFEWLYRAVQEPTRLGRRYLTTNAAFVALLAREMLRPTKAYATPTGVRSS